MPTIEIPHARLWYEDTGGDPATAVRKAQKLVEKDGVKFLTGVALSSEALAVSAKCPEWKVIFMSTINGAGALTAKAWNRYFFRVNTSGPMGARAISLYLAEGPMKRFFALGSDYAWGRDSVASFTSQITAAGTADLGRLLLPGGETLTVRLTATPLRAPQATHVLVLVEDITLQKRLERQMLLQVMDRKWREDNERILAAHPAVSEVRSGTGVLAAVQLPPPSTLLKMPADVPA